MTENNVIDARSLFIGKRLLNMLDETLDTYKDRYHSFYTLYDNEGEEWLELCLKDIETNQIIVVDMAPIGKFEGQTEITFFK